MPVIALNLAAEKLAAAVEIAKPTALAEIQTELFPSGTTNKRLSAPDLARIVRNGLEPEELVDLWNVIFPSDRNVWYNEADANIHYNEVTLHFTEAD